jgi:hypothetical protein
LLLRNNRGAVLAQALSGREDASGLLVVPLEDGNAVVGFMLELLEIVLRHLLLLLIRVDDRKGAARIVHLGRQTVVGVLILVVYLTVAILLRILLRHLPGTDAYFLLKLRILPQSGDAAEGLLTLLLALGEATLAERHALLLAEELKARCAADLARPSGDEAVSDRTGAYGAHHLELDLADGDPLIATS